jgi:hypothetical protein
MAMRMGQFQQAESIYGESMALIYRRIRRYGN